MLGSEQPDKASSVGKKVTRKVNPITGEVEGEAQLEPVKQLTEKFEKSCKIPPGGHSAKLW